MEPAQKIFWLDVEFGVVAACHVAQPQNIAKHSAERTKMI
jgi:hypothetical protein